MINPEEVLTPAKLRRLAEPLVKILAEIDRELYARDALVHVIYDLYLRALSAGIEKRTLIGIAEKASGMDVVLKAAPVPIDYKPDSKRKASLAVFKRHVRSLSDELSNMTEIESRVEGMINLAFEIAKSARIHGVPDSLLSDIITGVNQFHHGDNLDPSNLEDIKSQTSSVRLNAM